MVKFAIARATLAIEYAPCERGARPEPLIAWTPPMKRTIAIPALQRSSTADATMIERFSGSGLGVRTGGAGRTRGNPVCGSRLGCGENTTAPVDTIHAPPLYPLI